MDNSSEIRGVSYQKVYSLAVKIVTDVYQNWPITYPPNLIIHRNEPEVVKPDPRGTLQLMCMRTTAMIYNEPYMVIPYATNIHVYHPNILKCFSSNFNNHIAKDTASFMMTHMMIHEMFHLVNIQRAYKRCFDQYADCTNNNFATDLMIRHIDDVLGSDKEEQLTEHCALSTMIAFLFYRTGLSVKDLYNNTLLLPNIGGPFFQQYRKSISIDDEMYSIANCLQYLYHLERRAYDPDPEKREWHDAQADKTAMLLQAYARRKKEKCGKTYDIFDESD